MKHLDLFSGIGGFALAARWMGWETVAFCERDPFCQKILRKHWPQTLIYDDINTIPAEFIREAFAPDIITGGFPCQPFSTAGKKRGIDDERYLWPAMLAVIKTVRPAWIVGENVVGSADMALHLWKADLESEGYEVQCFDISASACGLPTMERHIWIIATAINQRLEGRKTDTNTNNRTERQFSGTDSRRIDGWHLSEPRFCRVGERVSRKLDRHDKERLRGLGNAIPPAVVFEIFKDIEAVEAA